MSTNLIQIPELHNNDYDLNAVLGGLARVGVVKQSKKDFHNIKSHFDTLNEDESHFVNSNDICTPMECVKEMVDTVPQELWQRDEIKVLDSCCGNGNFHGYIETKTDLKTLAF